MKDAEKYLFAVMMLVHPSGMKVRGASMRLTPNMSDRIRRSQLKVEEAFGTEAAPGPLRIDLCNRMPPIFLADGVTLQFFLQDSRGAPWQQSQPIVTHKPVRRERDLSPREQLENLFVEPQRPPVEEDE